MTGVSLVWVLVLAGLVIVAGAKVVAGEKVPPGARTIYWVSVLALALVAYLLTFHFEYDASDTRTVRGWPVAHVVFEHPETAANAEDFVGEITHLAYPVNLALLLLVPAVGLFLWRWRATRGNTRVNLL